MTGFRKGAPPVPSVQGSAPEFVSVTDLNRRVKQILETQQGLRSVWVLGELSNVRKSSSPHMFLKLKDQGSEIGLVLWGHVAEKFRDLLKEGAKVLVLGDVRVYEPRGVYQLYVDEVRAFGIGDLYARFEDLKRKLKDEGLFDQKRSLPAFPRVVAVITSPTGAAIRDILRNLTQRFPPARIILVPVQVQGEGAAEDIASGIRAANLLRTPRPDILIVGRGGGSIEDLWAFNEEVVARALFESAIPTISAVGHETDFTIADFVSDHRAATPTEAAVDAVPDKGQLLERLDNLQRGLVREVVILLRALEEKVERDADLLASLDPKLVLQRGYSIVAKEGVAIASVSEIQVGDGLAITMKDGEVGVTANRVRTA